LICIQVISAETEIFEKLGFRTFARKPTMKNARGNGMKNLSILFVVMVFIFSANVSAFNDTVTHRELGKFAVDESGTDMYFQ